LVVLNGVSAFFLWQNQQLHQALVQQQRDLALPVAPVAPASALTCERLAEAAKKVKTTPLTTSSAKTPNFAEQLKAGVAVKYALLLEGLNLGRLEREALEQLMFKREQLLNRPLAGYFVEGQDMEALIAEHEHKLSDLDEQVAQLLGRDAAQRYQLLKDSDLEQFQLREFEQRLTANNALEPDTRMRLLLSKLRNKKSFEVALQGINDLPFESAVRSEEMIKSLQRYQRNYYAEAETLLSEPSMKALRQLEDQRFEEMARSLSQQ
jgi:L-lactate utilization protein LutC